MIHPALDFKGLNREQPPDVLQAMSRIMLSLLDETAIVVDVLERARHPLRCPGLVLHCGGKGAWRADCC